MMRAPEGGELEVKGLPYLKHVVLISDEAASAPGINGYDEFLKGAERVSEDELKQRQESLHTDEVIKEKVEITRWFSEPGPPPTVQRPVEVGG